MLWHKHMHVAVTLANWISARHCILVVPTKRVPTNLSLIWNTAKVCPIKFWPSNCLLWLTISSGLLFTNLVASTWNNFLLVSLLLPQLVSFGTLKKHILSITGWFLIVTLLWFIQCHCLKATQNFPCIYDNKSFKALWHPQYIHVISTFNIMAGQQ